MQNIFASIQKYTKGMQTYPEVYKISKDIQEYTRVCKSMQLTKYDGSDGVIK